MSLFGKRKPQNNAQQQPPAPQNGGDWHITQLEGFIKQANANDPRLSEALKDAGMAYLNGTNGAAPDAQKGKQYLRQAAEKGNGMALFMFGMADVQKALEGESTEENKLVFSTGTVQLVKAHCAGYTPATDMLNDLIKDNWWPGVTCIEDLMKI